MSGQTWTPAPKKSAIPLHPMTFGMILGRSFAALRHNPKVIFGFAVVVQFIVTAIAAVVTLLVSFYAADRIASVPQSSPDFWPVAVGTIALSAVIGGVFGLASVAFTVVVQGLVAADVSYAALGRRAGLKPLWARVKPAFWRLFGWAMLQGMAVLLWFALLVGVTLGVFALSGADEGGLVVGILLAVLAALASIPLLIWISTKLLIVPSALVLEKTTIRSALVRSWRLIRGRFWVAFGVVFLVSAIMGIAAQVVSIPASLLSTLLGGVLAPTGDSEPTELVATIVGAALPQVLVLSVQAIALVVQATAATLIYLDSRMRYEGLDQTLVRFVERRATGTPDAELGDPFAVDAARAVSKTPPPKQASSDSYGAYGYAYQQGYPAAQGYPQGFGPGHGYSASPGYPTQPGPAQGYPPQQGYAPPQQGYAPAQQGYAPAQQGYAPAPGYAPPPQGYAAPQPPGHPVPPPPAPPSAPDASAPAASDDDPPAPWAAPGGAG